MMGWATALTVLTVPGQTVGVSSFIDYMIDALGVSRSALAGAYLAGTIIASTTMPAVGRWVDRRGVRRTTIAVGMAFVVAIAFTGFVQNLVMATVAFIGLRMLGQGSLTLISQTSISLWFEERRGRAFAISMTVSSGLMALSPLVITALIQRFGWRESWWILAAFIAVTVVPIGLFAIVDNPAAIGQVPDGNSDQAPEDFVPQPSLTVAEAIRSPAFYSLAGLGALASALSTALTFHNVSVMGAGGLTETEAAAVFLPIMLGTVSAAFVFGWMTDRVRGQVLLPLVAFFFAGASLAAIVVTPGLGAIMYGVVLGLAGGGVRALNGALFPKWYGTAHIGAIRGIVHTTSVAASAIGPLALSIGNDIADGYGPALVVSAVIAVAIGLASAFVRDPQPAANQMLAG